MTATQTSPEFLARLLEGAPDTGVPFARLRSQALERAHALALPGARDEDWRFSDPAALYREAFRAPGAAAGAPDAAVAAPWLLEDVAARLVFVDGRFEPALSRVVDTAQWRVLPLAGLEGDAAVGARLGALAGLSEIFRAINTAQLRDGALVHAGRGARLPGAVQVLHLATGMAAAVQPRLLVIAEAGSELTLVESHAAGTGEGYLVNAVTEVLVAPGARLRHARVQEEGVGAFHLATLAARIENDGVWESVSLALGARWSRLALEASIAGSGASAVLDGLALAGGRQLADTHSLVDHAVPHGHSRQLHKCVVDGAGHAVFNGRVRVRSGAQRTDSSQQSRTLLLSPRAHVDAKPQLEILADDVKCSHGATVGQLDADELFYLRSRGFSGETARALLTEGFAGEIIDRVPLPALAARLRAALAGRIHGAVIGEAA